MAWSSNKAAAQLGRGREFDPLYLGTSNLFELTRVKATRAQLGGGEADRL